MSRTTLSIRRLGTLAVLLGLALALLMPAAANAAAYRYWGYYQLSGNTWKFAATGPDQSKPADRSVEGWRFAVGTEKVTRFPRVTPTFDDICGDTAAKSGSKRIAVVIDYGRAADSADNSTPPAPKGTCAVVATTATGLEVLSKVAEVRSQKGLICGVDGYPASGCGDAVKTISTAAAAADTVVTLKPTATAKPAAAVTSASGSGGSHSGTYVGIGVAVLAALAVGLAALRRRGA